MAALIRAIALVVIVATAVAVAISGDVSGVDVLVVAAALVLLATTRSARRA